MTYSEAIAYLYSLTDYEKTRLARYAPDTLDLKRVERLLAALGEPHRNFPSVHIAGTKGKGSTTAMIESCLRAAGYRTGLYTSPHLHTFRERIQVNGVPIRREEVVRLVTEIQPFVAQIPGVTTFEAVTAMGFLYFARSGVEIAAVEVGLGGRLDATNVLMPEVCAITSISLDHMDLLGNTLAQIAAEKAGIIKPGVPVVTAPQHPEALAVIEATSQARSAPLTQVGRDWRYQAGPATIEGQYFKVWRVFPGASDFDGEYWLPLLGRHQLENATTAVAALDKLRERGFSLTAEAIVEGLRQVFWPARMEVLSRDPLVVVDAAHNPYSAQVLRQALEEWFPSKRWVLIFGCFVDKDAAGMLEVLLPISEYVIVTRSDHPRAAAPVKLADLVAAAGRGAIISVNMKKALRRALAMRKPEQGILVTGSVNLAGAARAEWAIRNGQTPPDDDVNARE